MYCMYGTWQKKVCVLRPYVGTQIFIGTFVAAGIYARRLKLVRPYPYYVFPYPYYVRTYSLSNEARSTKVYLPQKYVDTYRGSELYMIYRMVSARLSLALRIA